MFEDIKATPTVNRYLKIYHLTLTRMAIVFYNMFIEFVSAVTA